MRAALAGGLVVALVLRLPALLAERAMAFDDGAYGASVIAMRRGGLPFRDVFSSQGPLFLPVLWLGDLAGLRWASAPRLAAVAAGLALVWLAVALARRAVAGSGLVAAFVAAALVATSGVVVLATGRIESDGVVAAFGAGAVLAASSAGPVAAGVLAGAALGVKSLYAVPPVLAAAWLVWRRHGARGVGVMGAIAAAVVFVASVPWGLGRVWAQSVALHLDSGTPLDARGNVSSVARDLRSFDPMLLLAALAVVLLAIVGYRRRADSDADTDPGTDGDRRLLRQALVLWLVAAAAVLLVSTPLFTHHIVVIVVPAAIVIAVQAPPRRLTLVVLAGLLLVQLPALRFQFREPELTPNERQALADLRTFVPEHGGVVSDWPGLVWWSGRWTPGDMVDPSAVRIYAGSITAADVLAAAYAPGVCALVFWSGRFDLLKDLPTVPKGYEQVRQYNPLRRLLLRESCLAGTPGAP